MPTHRPNASALITWGTAVAGTLALAVAARGAPFPPAAALILVTALAAAAEYVRTPLPDSGYQTFGAAVSLPAIILLGPVPAAWASAAGVVIGEGLLRRGRIPMMLFNVGQRITAAILAGLAWNALAQGPPGWARINLLGREHLVYTAVLALMATYALTTIVLEALFRAASRWESFWSDLVTGAVWRLPTITILGTLGLAVPVLFTGFPLPPDEDLTDLLTIILTASMIVLLYTVRRQHLRDLASRHDAITDMLKILDLHEVLRVLADRVAGLARPDMTWIMLRRDDRALDVALARTPGADPELAAPAPVDAEDGLVRWVLFHRRPQLIVDYLDGHRGPREGFAGGDPRRVRAVLMVPLLTGIDPVGVIVLTHPTPGYFTEYHEHAIRSLAVQAAVVVRNAQLYETSQRTVGKFETLKAISDRIYSQQDLPGVIDLSVEGAGQLLAADRFALFLGEVGKDLTHSFTRNLPPEHVRAVALRFAKSTGLASIAMLARKPMIAADALADDRTNREMALQTGYRTVAAFPLEYRDAIIGVLVLYHNAVRPYASSDVALGTAFANQVAIAVQNTRLRQEAEGKAHQLSLLNRAFTRLATSLNPAGLFETLVEELHTTLNYAFVAIRLVDGDQLRLMASRGYGDINETRPITVGVTGRVARTGQPAFVTSVARDPDYVAQDPRVTQELCVPIVNRDRTVGVISVEAIEPRFIEGDFDLLTTLAGYAAVALEKAQLYEQTEALATTDGLTGLFNYRAFWQALERELERSMRYGLPLSLIMIEIDRFKRYNDTYGHLRGDEVIRLVARVLNQEHRAQIDLVARYGGDEFMILLPHTQKATAAEIAERVRRAVESTPLISESDVASVTLSLGVASYPEDGKSADALVEAADRSMYQAKTKGGNAVALAKAS